MNIWEKFLTERVEDEGQRLAVHGWLRELLGRDSSPALVLSINGAAPSGKTTFLRALSGIVGTSNTLFGFPDVHRAHWQSVFWGARLLVFDDDGYRLLCGSHAPVLNRILAREPMIGRRPYCGPELFVPRMGIAVTSSRKLRQYDRDIFSRVLSVEFSAVCDADRDLLTKLIMAREDLFVILGFRAGGRGAGGRGLMSSMDPGLTMVSEFGNGKKFSADEVRMMVSGGVAERQNIPAHLNIR